MLVAGLASGEWSGRDGVRQKPRSMSGLEVKAIAVYAHPSARKGI